jgi:hypothetical protein
MLKSGNEAPYSGVYKIVGPKGENTGRVVEVEKGDTLPPTPEPGEHFIPPRVVNVVGSPRIRTR